MATRTIKNDTDEGMQTSLDQKRARVTLILSRALDQNVELFCMVRGEKKTDVVQRALRDYLRNNGVAEPDVDYKGHLETMLTKGR